jgi:hypothetical protein
MPLIYILVDINKPLEILLHIIMSLDKVGDEFLECQLLLL